MRQPVCAKRNQAAALPRRAHRIAKREGRLEAWRLGSLAFLGGASPHTPAMEVWRPISTKTRALHRSARLIGKWNAPFGALRLTPYPPPLRFCCFLGKASEGDVVGPIGHIGRIGWRLRRFVQRVRPSRLPRSRCSLGRVSAPWFCVR